MIPGADLSCLLFSGFCIALASRSFDTNTRHSACQNAPGLVHDPTCWTALGYDSWLDTWKGPCPASLGCTCDMRKPWSDCVLSRYQNVGAGANTNLSCVDLSRPESCTISHNDDDWTNLSENQLAAAYVSTAVANLFHFVHKWYATITATPTAPAIMSLLSDQILSPSNDTANTNGTITSIPTFLTYLITQGSANQTAIEPFLSVIAQITSENRIVDIGKANIVNFQDAVSQFLNRTLNAILSDWHTPYFNALAQKGALLDNRQLERATPRNQSLATQAIGTMTMIQEPTNHTIFLTNTTTAATSSSRNLLTTTDTTQMWNYQILSCDASIPNSLATHLLTLLDTFHNNLYIVMRETTKGRRSHFGFYPLFKTQKWLPIRRLYENMHNAVGTAGNLAFTPSLPDARPVLICLQPHRRDTRAAYAVCAAQPRLRAFILPGAPHAIGLCPAFWALPRDPVRVFCPYKGQIGGSSGGISSSDSGSREYIDLTAALQMNQQSVLVQQLVRIYLGAGVLVPERFTLSEALKLNATEAYWNPSTWSYWFASVIGCTPSSWQDPDL